MSTSATGRRWRILDDAMHATAVAGTVLLQGCLAVTTPPVHRPLEVSPGHGIVVGRLEVATGDTVVPPTNPGADPRSAGLAPRAELRVYLERLAPRSVTLPPVTADGDFAWSLDPGDYLLLALPEGDVDAPSIAHRFRPVAAFRVRAGAVACVGALRLETPGPIVVDRGPLRVDPTVQRARVADACTAIAAGLATRYAPRDLPLETRLMAGAEDLAFRDPRLFDEVRRRLDLDDAERERPRRAAAPPDDRPPR